MDFAGRLRVVLTPGPDQAIIDFYDNGPGVPPDRAEQIFEPFHTSKQGGTGLGLSLSHNIIRNHGGDLALDPDYRGGAHFVVILPRAEKGSKNGGEQEDPHPGR
jgi:signal transduction histidine kinase